jgi:5-methylcytosine-specific restriction endonuclease McrA
MNAALERLVWQRAVSRCEYSRLPQIGSQATFEIDHIIARQHRGRTVTDNLALSCVYCNGRKGPNLTGRDPTTGKLTGSIIRDGTNGPTISATRAARSSAGPPLAARPSTCCG